MRDFATGKMISTSISSARAPWTAIKIRWQYTRRCTNRSTAARCSSSPILPYPIRIVIYPLLAYTFLNKGYSPLLDTIATKLSPEVMNSRYGKEFSAFVSNAKNTLVGMNVPDFELVKDSVAYTPKTFAGKNLFVVVWTSGNQQNIDYLSALKQVYEKWHDKGLEVLSSSIGGSDEEYGYDIYSLNLPWTEVRMPGE